jgi:hypothetical protein
MVSDFCLIYLKQTVKFFSSQLLQKWYNRKNSYHWRREERGAGNYIIKCYGSVSEENV